MTLRPGLTGRTLAATFLLLAGLPLRTDAQVATFRARVDTVRVDVLVTDRLRPVPGLTQGDFEVLDNGVPQAVTLVPLSDLPLNIVLALDTSGSVSGDRLTQLQQAGQRIIDRLKEGDQLGLLTFGTSVTLRTPLTTATLRARAGLVQEADGGNTALHDAIHAAIVLGEPTTGRVLVIVFSDGMDTASFLSAESVIATAHRGNAVVYAAATNDATQSTFLSDITAATGGRVVQIDASTNIDATFGRILDEFRDRYLLSFTPERVPERGWHRLEVRVKNRSFTISARPGYFSGGN